MYAMNTMNIRSLSLDPASLRSVRFLWLTLHPTLVIPPDLPLLPLLSQITSLIFSSHVLGSNLNLILAASTSLNSLSLWFGDIGPLNVANRLMVKQRITTLELTYGGGLGTEPLSDIIKDSVMMKKVILNGVYLNAVQEGDWKFVHVLGRLKSVCARKGIELWRQNFPTINGKVNLDAEE
jgi:hypothetical protein